MTGGGGDKLTLDATTVGTTYDITDSDIIYPKSLCRPF